MITRYLVPEIIDSGPTDLFQNKYLAYFNPKLLAPTAQNCGTISGIITNSYNTNFIAHKICLNFAHNFYTAMWLG